VSVNTTQAPAVVLSAGQDDGHPALCADCGDYVGTFLLEGCTGFVPYAVLWTMSPGEDDAALAYCLSCADAIAPLEGYVNRRYVK
jgi:hypothetical protein